VAGHSTGFLLLVMLRVLTKLALPATREGTRISVCIYFSATGLLVLSALFAYLFVLRPAVQAAASDRLESRCVPQKWIRVTRNVHPYSLCLSSKSMAAEQSMCSSAALHQRVE
jgi:hypothetical protein